MKRNSGLKHLMRTEHTAHETKAYQAVACADIPRIANRDADWRNGGLYCDKFQILARLDMKLDELKRNFSHDALVDFAAEAATCVASVIASYRCPVCRDTLTVWNGTDIVDCECTGDMK